MSYSDERIALLQKKARILRREKEIKKENEEEIKKENEDGLTIGTEKGIWIETRKENAEEAERSTRDGQGSEAAMERKEVTDLYEFEQEYFFDRQVTLQMPKDFFDHTANMEDKIMWQRNEGMSMILARQELLRKDILPVETLIKELQERNREQDFYVDFLGAYEEETESFRKQRIASRIPTSKGYIYQKQLNLLADQNWTSLVVTCYEKDKDRYEKLFDYILEHLDEYTGEHTGGECIE
ncbi:MAG TPA: hypothetical protein VHQ24_04150 [Lachnospiraceae bacterium]|nr:hypothetical protein [Lachnospiraceae bacterium]